MEKYISFFILSASISMPCIVVSENMLPPNGPYRSYEVDVNEKVSDDMKKLLNKHQAEINRILDQKNRYTLEKNTYQSKAHNDIADVDRRHADIPKWVRKNQQTMNRFNTLPPTQAWGQPPMQWVPNNQSAMRAPNQASRPQLRQQPIQQNIKTNRQYYPISRDKVNGSNVSPASRYNYPMQHVQPNYQMQRPMNQNQPMWR